MRFALFGVDPAGLAVARAVALHSAHKLTHCVGRPQSRPGMPVFAPGVRYCATWEELLSDPAVDAVIVTGRGEEPEQAVRQLVQAGKAVLVSATLVQPASFFYELALVDAEFPGRLFPLLGLRGHPLILKLRDLISTNALGRLHHAQLDRRIAVASSHPAPLFTEVELAQAILYDADILRTLCGAYDQVTASRSGDSQHGYSLATVTLAGSTVPQAVWTATATGGEGDWRLALAGESGTAVLEGDPDRGALRLTFSARGEPVVAEEIMNDSGSWWLETFDASVVPSRETVSLWGELARAIELVDAAERSVRRRRTIDVYCETPSERGIFKTQMTAVGCCLLVLTLGAVVIYLGLAATVELPPFLKKILVALIFVPLGVFLAMQLLLFVAHPATRDSR